MWRPVRYQFTVAVLAASTMLLTTACGGDAAPRPTEPGHSAAASAGAVDSASAAAASAAAASAAAASAAAASAAAASAAAASPSPSASPGGPPPFTGTVTA